MRTSTEIGAHSISMAAAAVRLAAQLFEDLREIRVLFVGAGEMIELVATHFAARNPKAHGAGQPHAGARRDAWPSRFGGEAMRLADMPARLHEFDAVVSCTASTLPIIGLGAVERALKARRHRPMFMVDLAVPRDIEPEVARLSDVYLYTVDDLSALVQTAGEKRQAAVEQAEAIIDAGVQSFSALARPARQRAADPGPQPPGRRLGRGASWRVRASYWRAASRAEQRARGLGPRPDARRCCTARWPSCTPPRATQRTRLADTVSRLFLRQNSRAARRAERTV